MNNGKRFFLIGVLSLVGLGGLARAGALEPNSVVKVADDHKSVGVTLANPYSADLFCDSVGLDVVLAGREYNDFSAHAKFHSQPLYLSKSNSVDLSEMGSEKALSAGGVLGIASAAVETQSCRIATFADYCAY